MPKLSKAQRKKQKAKAARKAAAMAKAYSRHKEYSCCHYGIRIKSEFLVECMDLDAQDELRKSIRKLLLEDCIDIDFYDNTIHPSFSNNEYEYYSLITEQGGEYVCSKCKYKFTKEQYELMKENFKNKKVLSRDDYNDERMLPDGVNEVIYYYSAPNKIVWKPYARIIRKRDAIGEI